MGGELTDRKLLNITEPGDYSDGDDANGLKAKAGRLSNGDLSIRWVGRVYIKDPKKGKTVRTRDLGLGVYPKVSLAEAREKAEANQLLGDRGIDPRSENKKKGVDHNVEGGMPTFDEVALEIYQADCERHANGQLRASTLKKKRTILNLYMMPAFPGRPLDEITMGDIENMMGPLYMTKRRTFWRVWSLTKAIFNLAIVRTPLKFNPANDAVLTALEALGKTNERVIHYDSVPYPRVAHAMDVIEKNSTNPMTLPTKFCLLFLVLTGCRPSEACEMKWEHLRWKIISTSDDWGEGVRVRRDGTLDYEGWEILDWNEYERGNTGRTAIWIIPPDNQKMNKPHRIPLSTTALNILREARILHDRWGSPHVFPSSRRPHGPLSESSLGSRCRKLHIDGSPHGFRTSFRNWCEDKEVPDNAAELALSHELDPVKRAYLRADLLATRATIMEYWSQFLRGDLPNDWMWITPAAAAQIKELNEKLQTLINLQEAAEERAQKAEMENAALKAELKALRELQPALGL